MKINSKKSASSLMLAPVPRAALARPSEKINFYLSLLSQSQKIPVPNRSQGDFETASIRHRCRVAAQLALAKQSLLAIDSYTS